MSLGLKIIGGLSESFNGDLALINEVEEDYLFFGSTTKNVSLQLKKNNV